jgi:D-xylose transport system substrate-binding protein
MNFKHALIAAALLASGAAHAQLVVGVSWSNFQEERWKTDEAAIKAELAKRGATYVSADAGGSPEKQLADVDGLIAKGAKALIVLAMDKDAIVPALAKAKQRSIPVIAYDRLIDQPGVYYITFDNKEVGRMQARAVLAAKPNGSYVMIKGSPTDPNADFLREGQQEVLAAAIKSGAVKIVGEEYTEGWKPEVAQKNMEQILTRNGNKVDAVVASNDGTAGGVVAALSARGISGVPVSGQDGARPRTRGGRRRGRSGRRQGGAGHRQVDGRRSQGDARLQVPQAGDHHQRQPRRGGQGRLDHQGQPVPRRGRGQGPGRLQVRRHCPPRATRARRAADLFRIRSWNPCNSARSTCASA